MKDNSKSVKPKLVKAIPKKFLVSPAKTKKTSRSYAEDFYQWTQHQAQILKKRDFAHLDFETYRKFKGNLNFT